MASKRTKTRAPKVAKKRTARVRTLLPAKAERAATAVDADAEGALQTVLDAFVEGGADDKKRGLVVLEGLVRGVSAEFDEDGPPFDGVELDQDAWISHALDAWRDMHAGLLLPDQGEIKRACRLLAERLVQCFQGPWSSGKRAEYTLGRRGHKTRLWLSQALLEDLAALIGQGAHNLAGRAAPPGRITSAELKAKLGSRGNEIERFHVASLEVFGSVARGEARPDSDVDLLVTLDRPTTADDYFGLKFFLEDLLGRRVDLVVRAAVPPDRLERIEREAIHVA